jgi:hypothetical protein
VSGAALLGMPPTHTSLSSTDGGDREDVKGDGMGTAMCGADLPLLCSA